MIAIHDPKLPGLSGLDAAALQRITGAEDVSLMRFRYRAGKRAILHLETEAGEGSVWFFQGDKARRLARRNKPTARYDRASEALYETFPNDHRMPQIRAFLDDYARVARELIGGRPAGAPDLLRYRPGLSCTFRCRRADGVAVYVKLINDDSPARLAEMNRQMVAHLAASSVSVAPVIGIAPERAAECVDMTRLTVPAMTDAVARVFARLEADPPRLAMRPIHADVKLEHLFIDAGQTTLIDTESVSLGPPDYDLAQLFGWSVPQAPSGRRRAGPLTGAWMWSPCGLPNSTPSAPRLTRPGRLPLFLSGCRDARCPCAEQPRLWWRAAGGTCPCPASRPRPVCEPCLLSEAG